MALTFTFIIPGLIALLTGVRGYRDKPRTSKDFAIGAFWTMLFGLVYVFAWHVIWLGAASVSTGTAEGLVGGAAFQTAVSFVVWFPLLMISYVFNAQRGIGHDL